VGADLVKLPNLLTLFRLASVPFVAERILAGDDRTALVLFFAAAATDALDGLAARRLGMASRLGAYLDPVTDKIFLGTTYVALAAAGRVPWWLVGLIFGRDLAILGGAAWIYIRTGRRDFPPSVWGKASTLFQIALAVAVVMRATLAGPLTLGVAGLTAWSGIDYLRRGRKMAGS
jgi:cardiolipin synthase